MVAVWAPAGPNWPRAPAEPNLQQRRKPLAAAAVPQQHRHPARAAARYTADAAVEHRRRHKLRFSRTGAWRKGLGMPLV